MLPSETTQRVLVWTSKQTVFPWFVNDMSVQDTLYQPIHTVAQAPPYWQHIRVGHSAILMDYIPSMRMGCLQLLYIWSEVKQMDANSVNASIVSSWFVWGSHSQHFSCLPAYATSISPWITGLFIALSSYVLHHLLRCLLLLPWISWRRAGNCTWTSVTATTAENHWASVSSTYCNFQCLAMQTLYNNNNCKALT